MELEAILVSPNRSCGIAMLHKAGLAKVIFPAMTDDQLRFASVASKQLPEKIDFPLALAGFFADCETEFVLKKCRSLRLSRSQNKHVRFLLANRGKLLNDRMSLADLKLLLVEPYFDDLYHLQKAVQKAQKKSIVPLTNLRKKIKSLGDIEIRPKPLLNGHDLIALGAVPGPALGQLAREMYIAQLETKLQTTAQAERWVKKWLQKHREMFDY